MARLTNLILITLLVLTARSCLTASDKPNQTTGTSMVKSGKPDVTSLSKTETKNVLRDSLPIHGQLDQKQIDRYYPNVIDTIKDRRIIVSEPIEIRAIADVYLSMLHNVGTNDQMFLCTHDKSFKLLDSYYIGISTMFDKTGHTIEFKKTNDNCLEFYHVDWGYVKNEIDTLKYKKCTLTLTRIGKIDEK